VVDANLARRSVQHSRAACRSIIWEIWALSVDDREVDSVVVDEGETDEKWLRERDGLSAGGKRIRTLSPTRDALDFETVFPLYDGSISRKGSVRALPGLRVRIRLSPGLRQQRTGARRSHHEAQTKDSAGWVVAFDTSKLANGSAMANAWCSDPADGSGSGGGAGVWMANAAPPSTKTAISTW